MPIRQQSGFLYIKYNMKDSFGKEWGCSGLDKFCHDHRITIDEEYKTVRISENLACTRVMAFTKCYISDGRLRVMIYDRSDKHPISELDLLTELKRIMRERKLAKLLS